MISVTPAGYNECHADHLPSSSYTPGLFVVRHEFPVVRRPGRPRLYCDHACRQRAYEHRHGFEHERTVRPLPAQARGETWTGTGYERSVTGMVPGHGRVHALRTSVRPEGRRRETLCGLLGRSARRSALQRIAPIARARPVSPSRHRIRCASASPRRTNSLVFGQCSTRSTNAASTQPKASVGSPRTIHLPPRTDRTSRVA